MMHSYVIQFEGLPAAVTVRCPPRQFAFCVARPLGFSPLFEAIQRIGSLRETRPCHTDSAEHSSRAARDAVLMGEYLPEFRRTELPSSSGLSSPNRLDAPGDRAY
jgi:hypothetical protein